MRVHDAKLQNETYNQLVLLQERICNKCRVSIIVP